MKAIRWIGAGTCEFCDQDSTPSDPTPLQIALWEKNPSREISVEITPHPKDSFGRGVGLLIDPTQSKLVRVYALDGWTSIMEDGISVRSERETRTDECRVDFGTSWEDCSKIYHSVPREERDEWSEGVINSPQYTHIVLKDKYDEELLRAVQSVFDLPMITDLES